MNVRELIAALQALPDQEAGVFYWADSGIESVDYAEVLDDKFLPRWVREKAPPGSVVLG